MLSVELFFVERAKAYEIEFLFQNTRRPVELPDAPLCLKFQKSYVLLCNKQDSPRQNFMNHRNNLCQSETNIFSEIIYLNFINFKIIKNLYNI